MKELAIFKDPATKFCAMRVYFISHAEQIWPGYREQRSSWSNSGAGDEPSAERGIICL
jgi:hypothetical protein